MSTKLDIERIFKIAANKILSSREKSITIHSTKDISTAGDEVEITVRNFFKEMLPEKYNVGKGHLIDCNGITSPQLDL